MKKYITSVSILLLTGVLIAGCGKSEAQTEPKAITQTVGPQTQGKILYSWTGFNEKPYGERRGVCIFENGNIRKYPDISYAKWTAKNVILGFVGGVTREQTHNTLEKIDVDADRVAESVTIPRGIGRYQLLPNGNKILIHYQEQKEKKHTHNLAILDLKTNQIKKITAYPVGKPWVIYGFDYNPENELIAYAEGDHTKLRSSVIKIIDLNGKLLIETLPAVGAMDPRWSPDGSKIVFTAIYPSSTDAKSKTAVTLYDVKTKTMKRLTYHDSITASPTFSPDGKQIVYVLWGAGGRANNLGVINIDGTGFQTLLPEDHIRQGQVSNPDWGP